MNSHLEELSGRVDSTLPSRRGTLFASRPVAVAGPDPSVLAVGPADRAVDVPWPSGEISREEFLRRTGTNAFLVVRDGLLTQEWYAPGIDPAQLHSSWSVAKSIVSLLLAHAIDDELVALDDRLVDILPEFSTGEAFDDITVRHLVDMCSGIDVPENVDDARPDVGTRGLYFTADIPGYLLRHRSLYAPAGTVGSYRSVNTAYLGLILARVTGRELADLASDWLWQPIGAESAALWNLDRPGGIEKAFCCVNATARDFARLGRLVAGGGSQDRQLVAAAWLEQIRTPAELAVESLPYSAHWWPVRDDTTGEGDTCAIGIHGQYIYVNPRRRVAIVKLSDHGTEEDEQETVQALRHIALTGRAASWAQTPFGAA